MVIMPTSPAMLGLVCPCDRLPFELTVISLQALLSTYTLLGVTFSGPWESGRLCIHICLEQSFNPFHSSMIHYWSNNFTHSRVICLFQRFFSFGCYWFLALLLSFQKIYLIWFPFFVFLRLSCHWLYNLLCRMSHVLVRRRVQELLHRKFCSCLLGSLVEGIL